MKTIASLILSELANERRVIAADWRIHVHYHRVARANAFRLPDRRSARDQIQKMQANGLIENIEGVAGVYKVVVPYASTIPTSDEAIVQEANPYATFNCFTAMSHHGLTDEVPQQIYASHSKTPKKHSPLGSTPDDWVDMPAPPARQPRVVGSRSVVWTHTKDEWNFGHMIGYIASSPAYVTDLERTLIDTLRFPEKCGGVLHVFRAWKRANDSLQIDRLLNYVELLNQTLLRQRVGYVLESLGREHSRLESWVAKAVRGSSAKLLATEAFSSVYSERWALSLNAPPSVLSELRD